MDINQHNYEIFILDYYEGTLDAKATGELLLYLEQNTEAKEAFESYEAITIEPEMDLKFHTKLSLKKNEIIAVDAFNGKNYEHYFIESVEQTLSAAMLGNLDEFILKNPQLNKNLGNFRKTILEPDYSIVYPEKELLKKIVLMSRKQNPIQKMVLYSVSVAAALAIVIFSGIVIRLTNIKENTGSNALAFDNVTNNRNTFTQIHNTTTMFSSSSNPKQYTASSENISNANSSANLAIIDKIESKKFLNVELAEKSDFLTSATLEKQTEYTDIYYYQELIATRRDKAKLTSENAKLAEYVVGGIKKAARSTSKSNDINNNNNKIGFWDIAGFGVYAYNKIANDDLTLERKTNASGKFMSVKLTKSYSKNHKKK